MQERNHGELAAVNQERTARIRVLVFLFFHFPSVVVRSSTIEMLGMATVGRGDNELERHGVIKTLFGAGVESTRELRERLTLGLCKATIHFGSQYVAGSKPLSMPLVAGQSVVDRPDLFRDIGVFQHRQ